MRNKRADACQCSHDVQRLTLKAQGDDRPTVVPDGLDHHGFPPVFQLAARSAPTSPARSSRFPAIDSQWVLEEPAGWVRLVVVGIERRPGQEPRVHARGTTRRRLQRRFHLGYFQKWAREVAS